MKKRRLNRLDIFILVVVIVIIGIFIFKKTTDIYDPYKSDGGAIVTKEATLTYVIEDVRDYSYNAIKVGDRFYDDDSGSYLGEVSEVIKAPYHKNILTNEGEYVYAPVPGKYTLYIRLSSQILETDQKYLAGGNFELKINSRIRLASNRVFFEGALAEIN